MSIILRTRGCRWFGSYTFPYCCRQESGFGEGEGEVDEPSVGALESGDVLGLEALAVPETFEKSNGDMLEGVRVVEFDFGDPKRLVFEGAGLAAPNKDPPVEEVASVDPKRLLAGGFCFGDPNRLLGVEVGFADPTGLLAEGFGFGVPNTLLFVAPKIDSLVEKGASVDLDLLPPKEILPPPEKKDEPGGSLSSLELVDAKRLPVDLGLGP